MLELKRERKKGTAEKRALKERWKNLTRLFFKRFESLIEICFQASYRR
jgi:hypothetical protein